MSDKVDFDVLKAGEKDETLGKVIKEVILTSTTFIVYMDTDDVIQWSAFNHSIWGKNFGKIQNEVSFWESNSNRIFNKQESYSFKTLLAEGYARILDSGDDESALEIIARTKERIEVRGAEVLRSQYILGSLITALFVTLVIVISKIWESFLTMQFGRATYEILIVGLFGGIGAFLSAMLRVNNYKAEIFSSRAVHRLDGFLRILFGIIAGVIIVLGVKSNIILGFIKDRIFFAEVFMGIIAGSSEIIIPNIIKSIEAKAKV